MKKALQCIALISMHGQIACQPIETADVVFSNVHVIDVVNGQIVENRDVLIEGTRIKGIVQHGRTSFRADRIIEGTSNYLVPGFWDMHVHFRINKTQHDNNPPETLAENKDLLILFLAYGITSVHDMGSDITDHLVQWRSEIDAGVLNGPSLYFTGPKIEGPTPLYAGSLSVSNREQADRALETLQVWNVDGVKLMGGPLDPGLFTYVLEQSKILGLKTYAHLFENSSAVDASEHSLSALAHMLGAVPESSPEYRSMVHEMRNHGVVTPAHPEFSKYAQRMYANVDATVLKENVDILAANGTWLISTYNGRKVRTQIERIPDHIFPDLDYVGANIRRGIRSRYEQVTQHPSELVKQSHENNFKLLQLLPDSEASLLIGTDAGTGNIVPGRSYHLEMASMVEDGLEPAFVLRAATWNAARFMGKENAEGLIATGKIADLVLLDENPLEDMSNTSSIIGVMRNGKWFARPDIDRLLDGLKKKYAEGQGDQTRSHNWIDMDGVHPARSATPEHISSRPATSGVVPQRRPTVLRD